MPIPFLLILGSVAKAAVTKAVPAAIGAASSITRPVTSFLSGGFGGGGATGGSSFARDYLLYQMLYGGGGGFGGYPTGASEGYSNQLDGIFSQNKKRRGRARALAGSSNTPGPFRSKLKELYEEDLNDGIRRRKI